MIRGVQRWRAFEDEWVAANTLDYAENLRLVDSMYEYARKLGKFTAEDALEGIEKTIRVARAINSVRRTP
jgi:hypothetical protein